MTERDDGDDDIFEGESDELVRARAELKKLIRPAEDAILWKHTVGQRPAAHVERVEARQANAAARVPMRDEDPSLDFLDRPEFSIDHDGEWDSSGTPSPAPRHSFFRPRLRRRPRVTQRRAIVVAALAAAAVGAFFSYRLLQRPIVPPPVVALPTPRAPRFEVVDLRPVESPQGRSGSLSAPRLPAVTPQRSVEAESLHAPPAPAPAPSAAKPSTPRRDPPPQNGAGNPDYELLNPEIRRP